MRSFGLEEGLKQLLKEHTFQNIIEALKFVLKKDSYQENVFTIKCKTEKGWAKVCTVVGYLDEVERVARILSRDSHAMGCRTYRVFHNEEPITTYNYGVATLHNNPNDVID